ALRSQTESGNEASLTCPREAERLPSLARQACAIGQTIWETALARAAASGCSPRRAAPASSFFSLPHFAWSERLGQTNDRHFGYNNVQGAFRRIHMQRVAAEFDGRV